ncbi:MAG TPA: hypothetical protein VI565_02980 [Burkholderiales bacterium]|nr:hypothetical protein [Burkholderiales bacterium]
MITGTWVRVLCVMGLTLLLSACASGQASRHASDRTLDPARQTVVSGEYILSARPNVSADAIRRLYETFDVESVKSLGANRYWMRLARDPGIERVQRIAAESGQFEAVQPNYAYRTR